MVMTPVYLFTLPGNPTVKISDDQLRSLLSNIEAQLHSSKIYLLTMAKLQNLLGSSAEPMKILLKAVGREAISLAFQQFVQPEQVTKTPISTPTSESETVKNDANINAKPETNHTENPTYQVPGEFTVNSAKNTHINPVDPGIKKWFQVNKKTDNAHLEKQNLAEQRREIICNIGEQLKQARESQGLSLYQLHIYTHIPIHYLEAIENRKFDLLPEDTLLCRFVRSMGNALGLNGTILAASLPANDPLLSIATHRHDRPQSSHQPPIVLNSIHLYLGYTALMAGAMGGLTLTSQQANNGRVLEPDIVNCPSYSISPSSQMSEVCMKPGLNSSGLDANVAPPETF
jgi:cytoskeleton protein RodZ